MLKESQVITAVLYKRIVDEYVKRVEESKSPNIIYVTDLVGCTHKFHMRKIYTELTLAFEPSMILGDLVHKGLESLMVAHGFQPEVEISRTVYVDGVEYQLRGRVDLLDSTRGIVVEVKSSKTHMGLPREHHLYQLNIYLNMLNYDKGILLYITPSKIAEYEVSRTQISIDNLVKEVVEDARKPRFQWECKMCPFRKICTHASTEPAEQ